ncbi:MAG: HEPN domain-containing protein [Candidatus Wallbacteria bacterium]|nr:HEPN domain-containing protein [Candidatus Wallbacteria bacterium]
MVDIEKQTAYWISGAGEDLEVALKLVSDGRIRHGLFFAHLSLEKYLKAAICNKTQNLAPPLHNLVRLSEIAGLSPAKEHLELLADMNQFNIEGRYPVSASSLPVLKDAREYLRRTQEAVQWLKNQF